LRSLACGLPAWSRLLFIQPDYELLELPHIIERDFSCLGELRHHRLCLAAKQAENVIKEPASRSIAGYNRLEDVGVADLSYPPHGPFGLQPENDRLYCGVSGLRLGEAFQYFANGRLSTFPKSLNDLQFKPGKFHSAYYA
jgi:hypothetical protein